MECWKLSISKSESDLKDYNSYQTNFRNEREKGKEIFKNKSCGTF